ncbi:uncharacterized protein LOC109613309 [Musca domestica]|uniref:Uncharacterized protein LOC109613309 n=1 Tax=Musca domestica TaxID=7370 RepID=A0A9J7DIG5_MUSDO|nr:uncharacterized protein LOC109613309 [Musca domestica]
MTMPLDGYLEAPRLSCYSQTHSDLSRPKYSRNNSEDGSSDVFITTTNPKPRPSPILLSVKTLQDDLNKSAASSMISSNFTRETSSSLRRNSSIRRRQSSVNAVSWNDNVSIQQPSTNSPPSKRTADAEAEQVTMRRQRLLHRRHQSVGNAKYDIRGDEQSSQKASNRRRSSSLWWAQEEAVRRNAQRPCSWGPAGMDVFATDSSLMCNSSAVYPCDLRLLHGQCIHTLWIGFFYFFTHSSSSPSLEYDILFIFILTKKENDCTKENKKNILFGIKRTWTHSDFLSL